VSRHEKTSKLIEMAAETLRQHHSMAVRQVYYWLVSQQVIENTRSSYQSVSKALVAARHEGLIPWRQIENRLRKLRRVRMWSGLPDLAETAKRSIRLSTSATMGSLSTSSGSASSSKGLEQSKRKNTEIWSECWARSEATAGAWRMTAPPGGQGSATISGLAPLAF
jgi:hypothetical protein